MGSAVGQDLHTFGHVYMYVLGPRKKGSNNLSTLLMIVSPNRRGLSSCLECAGMAQTPLPRPNLGVGPSVSHLWCRWLCPKKTRVLVFLTCHGGGGRGDDRHCVIHLDRRGRRSRKRGVTYFKDWKGGCMTEFFLYAQGSEG